jgi:phenylacetate-CoA ligase
VAVDDAQGTSDLAGRALGPAGERPLFLQALTHALSLFNDREANTMSIEQTGYTFRLRFVPRSSPRIERTPVGKTPLVWDRG